VIANPRPLKRRLKTLKRLHQAVSRKVKGSQNRKKAARRLGHRYRKVANQRQNALHQLTTSLAQTKSVIVIEHLNVAGMLQNHRLAQAIGNVGFAEFRRQLLYKAAWYGCQVMLADRWEPSSKTCSGCGWYDETLALADRTFRCRNPRVPCGLVLDRDLNASLYLAKLAQLAGSSSDHAHTCGEGSAGQCRAVLVKLPSVKQEPDLFLSL
jgi:putative transposase